MKSGFVKISEKQTPRTSLTLTFSAEDFPASLFQMLETGRDLPTQGVRCSLKLPGWLKQKSLRIYCLKTYPDCLAMTGAGRLRPSSIRWTDWGMVWNGRCLTAKISESPNPAAVCTLSDILIKDVGEKYYLSPKQQERLLCKSAQARRENGSIPPME